MYLEEFVNDLDIDGFKFSTEVTLNRENSIDWLKTIASFANCCGGSLFIGVQEKTNKLIGFDKKSADNERNCFIKAVNEHLFPRPKIRISLIKYLADNEERFIIYYRGKI